MARKTETKICLSCCEELASSSFYNHRNDLIDKRFGFCKKCVTSRVDLDNLETLFDFLRTMNIPYLRHYWKIANDSKASTIGIYLKNLNSLNQNKGLKFRDSDDMVGKTNSAELINIETNFEVTRDIVKRWGKNLELDDYLFLEEEYISLGGSEVENTVQERLVKNMAKTQLMANIASEEGDVTRYEKMMKVLSTLMNDANIKPVQVKSASMDGKTNSFGEFIRNIEETEPIAEDYSEYEPKFIKDYVERFFIHQMKRVFGFANKNDIKKLDGEE